MKHKHRFVAWPLTGQNMASGKEGLIGWKLECEHCYKQAKTGDNIEEIKQSHWREIVPKAKLVNLVY